MSLSNHDTGEAGHRSGRTKHEMTEFLVTEARVATTTEMDTVTEVSGAITVTEAREAVTNTEARGAATVTEVS